MSASVSPPDDEFTPAEFSPSPELVRVAVVVLAVAGVAGLWKGLATAAPEVPAPVPVVAASTPATALPAVSATSDTLLPPQALGPTVATLPEKAAPASCRRRGDRTALAAVTR